MQYQKQNRITLCVLAEYAGIHSMFAEIIVRWVALASSSDDARTRAGHHSRHLDWPDELVLAENKRLLFDLHLARLVAYQQSEATEIALAFAMGTHQRVGRDSAVLCLIPDLVRHILHRDFLHTLEHAHRETLLATLFVQSADFLSPSDYLRKFCVQRLLLHSEIQGVPAFQWSRRPPFFFCKRGWFAGVGRRFAPPDARADATVTGIFESIPHVFCNTRFPVCRPFPVCRHLLHVSRLGTAPPDPVQELTFL